MRASKFRLPDSTAHVDEAAVGDRLRDLVEQRARVADAGRAAVADRVEPELVEEGLEPGALVVVGDDREPGASEVFTHGARRRPSSTARLARRPAATITCGFDVFVHEVIAAITTVPWPSSTSSPSSADPNRAGARRCRDGDRGPLGLVDVRAARRLLGRRVAGRERLLDRLVVAVRLDAEGAAAPRGTPASPARAARGPAGGAARRATARRRRGRARRPASTPGAPPARARAGSRGNTPRRAPRAPATGPSGAGSRASARPPGRSRTSRRTRATCSRASRGRRP